MANTLRLFIALELPQSVLDALLTVQDDLADRVPARTVRWVRPQGIHLTLKFIGETPAARQDAITAALQDAVSGHGPLALHAAGLGCFPNTRRPRVVWVGLGGDIDPLTALQGSVESALEPLGYAREKRRFSPHLTLGRVRRDASAAGVQALGGRIAGADVGHVATWTASAVSLMRSDLRPDGARYTCLAAAPLRG